MRILALAGLMLLGGEQVADAQEMPGGRDSLVALYRVTIAQELCHFGMTDAQATAIGSASDKLEEELELSEAAAESLYSEASVQIASQPASVLCDPNGELAANFRQILAQLGK